MRLLLGLSLTSLGLVALPTSVAASVRLDVRLGLAAALLSVALYGLGLLLCLSWDRGRLLRRLARDARTCPYAFEAYCAALLDRAGWDAEVVGGSGDQGADVIARRRHESIVLQCKLYARPVGNRAVQEAHAGRGMHETELAAVVAPAGFTRAAHAAAEQLDVQLLAPSDLADV